MHIYPPYLYRTAYASPLMGTEADRTRRRRQHLRSQDGRIVIEETNIALLLANFNVLGVDMTLSIQQASHSKFPVGNGFVDDNDRWCPNDTA